ncbi:MAG: DMT family transporter [Halofilum sp. (in: g-proteobacteria)]|nr:DMT family transporter [Halofilum sp. (in: g-proteobacteria)]
MQAPIRRNHPVHAPVGGVVPAAVAVALWSLTPVLAELAHAVPPLQLAAMVAGVATLATWPLGRAVGRRAGDPVAVPARTWLAGPLLVLGAVGFYFVALRLAPAAEVALVAYTWPALFVIAAELIQVRRVHASSLAGTALAFGGAALVLVKPSAAAGDPAWAGYFCAFASGTCWAAFSLLARQQPVPLSGIMPRLFGLATVWAVAGHLLVEQTLWSVATGELASIAFIGFGPYGLAFVAWDTALRRGRSATVGTLAYAVPVLSALLLIAAGMASIDWRLAGAAMAVVAGCAVASRRRPEPAAPAWRARRA